MSKRLLYVVNSPDFFLSHRKPLAVAARKKGYSVHVATGFGEAVQQIVESGFTHHVVPLSRSGKNLVVEYKSLLALYRLMREIKPDLVHLVTIKPILYGGIAARLSRVHGVVAAISGLGAVYISQGVKAALLRSLVKLLYKLALGHNNVKVIFQNPDDRSALIDMGAVRDEQTVLIRGSGVRLADYPVVPEPKGVPIVTMAARLLKDKGTEEFVSAAKILNSRGLDVRFILIGSPDPGNPATVLEDELNIWREEAIVELLGYRTDIASLFANSNVVVLPSYREGLPKVLVEAAACARAVVTTDVPGCRDAIEPAKTGLLVPVKNAEALADAIERLINNAGLRRQFGHAGRELAEREFAIEKIINAHLVVYQELDAHI